MKPTESTMDTVEKETTDLIAPKQSANGRPIGAMSPATVKNSAYTDTLREKWHDPAITVLRMTLPKEHPQYESHKLPFDKEEAEVLVKLCKYFHHPRTPIKTDGSDSEKKHVSFNISMPNPKDVPMILDGHSVEVEDDK